MKNKNSSGCVWIAFGAAVIIFLLMVGAGSFAVGLRSGQQPPAIGSVTITGNGNSVINQAGDGNSASVEQARPRRSGNEYEIFFGVGIAIVALGMIAVSFATAMEEDRWQ